VKVPGKSKFPFRVFEEESDWREKQVFFEEFLVLARKLAVYSSSSNGIEAALVWQKNAKKGGLEAFYYLLRGFNALYSQKLPKTPCFDVRKETLRYP
jgi:hypothetical protein